MVGVEINDVASSGGGASSASVPKVPTRPTVAPKMSSQATRPITASTTATGIATICGNLGVGPQSQTAAPRLHQTRGGQTVTRQVDSSSNVSSAATKTASLEYSLLGAI